MSIVMASPEPVGRLGRTLLEVAAELVGPIGHLQAAADQFVATGADAGLIPAHELSEAAGEIGRQATAAGTTGAQVAEFVGALEAADVAGATRYLRFGFGRPGLLIIDESLLATFAFDSSTSLLTMLQLLRHRRDALLAARPQPTGAFEAAALAEAIGEVEASITRLDAMIGQLAAELDRGRPPGWAGVAHETWPSAAALFAAAALGRATAATIRGEALGRPPGATSTGTDDTPTPSEALGEADFARRHPFLSAALVHGVLITPQRLELLMEMDRLATAPIDVFVEMRDLAVADLDAPPRFDWSTDECSGPVIEEASDHCLQHDWLYRNIRMLRDQWGLPQAFADDLKAFADSRFAVGVLGDTPRWLPRPELFIWSGAAGVAVDVLGSVDTPWEPPARPR